MSTVLPMAPRDRRSYRASGLAEAIEELGVTQSDVARALGVPRQNINALIAGRVNTKIDRATHIAGVLGRPVSELFEPVGP